MTNVEIIPALLVESQEQFEQQLKLVENEVSTVQVDILDGSVFDKTSWFDAEAVGQIKTPVEFELHLMVENPLPIIDAWAKHVPSTVRAIIHAELDRPLGTIVEWIHQNDKLEAGIALNPETPIDEIHHVVQQVDQILVMGVHPGASGQEFGDSRHGISGQAILEKIERISHRYPEITLGVDGAVSLERAPELKKRGASRLCIASAIFKADDPKQALHQFKSVI